MSVVCAFGVACLSLRFIGSIRGQQQHVLVLFYLDSIDCYCYCNFCCLCYY